MDTISELCNYDCATVIFDRLIPIELEMFRDNFESSGLGAEIRSASRIRAMEMVAKNYWRNRWTTDGGVMWQLAEVTDEELVEQHGMRTLIKIANAGEGLKQVRPDIYFAIKVRTAYRTIIDLHAQTRPRHRYPDFLPKRVFKFKRTGGEDP